MKQFFKIIFGSCLGVILAGLVLSAIGAGVVGNLIQGDHSKSLEPNTVLKISLGNVPELTNNTPNQFENFDFENPDVLGFFDIIRTIEKAKDDKNIAGVVIDLDNHNMKLSHSALLKETIRNFKENTDKFVLAYGSTITHADYMVGVEADKLILNPLGYFDFRGFGASVEYMKDFYDQIGVNWETFYAGKFKGASEPNRLSEMSPENRLQIRKYLQGLWDAYLNDISASRNIPVSELNAMANTLEIRNPQVAVAKNLIDTLGYYGDAISYAKRELGIDPDAKFSVIKVSDYRKNVKISPYKSGDKIALVYAEGVILGGEGSPGSITDTKYVPMLRKIRFDEDVKALVLRVNSPGGSALASENILIELKKFEEKGIPVVVSMGNVAASGGYYISCAADSIFAEPYTITGSIGVVGQIPIVQELLQDKLKINTDTVRVTEYALSGTDIRFPFNKNEKQFFQNMVDSLYHTFVGHVSNARGMSFEAVDKVAQGRVWAANDALQHNLVDDIGGLDRAIASAKALANLDEEVGISEYPKIENSFEQMLKSLTKKPSLSAMLEQEDFKVFSKMYQDYQTYSKLKGPLFMMPYEINVE